MPLDPVPTPFSMAEYCVTGPASRHPAKDALVVVHAAPEGGEVVADRWTYAEVEGAVLACADRLAGLGLGRGDRVLLRMGNRAAFPFAFFGAMATGLVAVPVSDQLTGEEADRVLEDSGAAAVVHDPTLPLTVPPGVVVLPADEVDHRSTLPEVRGALRRASKGADPDDPAFMTYTSGTTGRPKGVLHAHRSAWGRRPMYDGWYGLSEDDVVLHAGALSWTYTLGVGLTDPWAVGATAVVYDGPRDGLVWPRVVAGVGATIFAAVPGVYRHLLRHGDPTTWDLRTLRHGLVAGEALPRMVLDGWTEATGRPLYESLGMSEISTFVSTGPSTPVRPGSPGRAQPGRRVAALDPDTLDREVAAGEVGRLAVHRSDPGLMLGYWRRPEETAEVFRGEWFVSADLVRIDADGYLTYEGRADDVMTAMGYRVAPGEVEGVLATCPGVAEAAVVAVDRGEGVSIITAVVVPTPDADREPLPDAVLAHCAEHLARYKCPREVRIVDSLPRTPNGKLRRADLRTDPTPRTPGFVG